MGEMVKLPGGTLSPSSKVINKKPKGEQYEIEQIRQSRRHVSRSEG
jgi:hypothetical protein